ncbi:MAG: glutamate 5-kinase, partial [Micrococcales bacterium]
MSLTRNQLSDAKRVVIKIGSSSITGDNSSNLDVLVDSIAAATKRGQKVIVVTSGAIATGMPLLGF